MPSRPMFMSRFYDFSLLRVALSVGYDNEETCEVNNTVVETQYVLLVYWFFASNSEISWKLLIH